jgi:hypothetical protein
LSEVAKSKARPVGAVVGELVALLTGSVNVSILKAGHFGCILRAALAKSLEFAAAACREPPASEAFFQTATLRGICEDLIVLEFIGKLDAAGRDRVCVLLAREAIAEGLMAQAAFLGQQRPWQPLLRSDLLGPRDAMEHEIRQISATLGWVGRSSWPSVWFMAKACSEEALYSYLYSATSKWVHFSPHVLLRMGWGGSKDDLGDHTEWHFTTSNFERYYQDFNKIYSCFLLLRLLEGSGNALVPAAARPLLDELRAELGEQLRWPEAVTFEEMNVEAPGPLLRVLLRVVHDDETKNSDGRRTSKSPLKKRLRPIAAHKVTRPSRSSPRPKRGR